MLKYLKKMTRFLVFPLIIFIILEIILRIIPNDYKLKKDYIRTKGDKIENLILGSSHTYKGIKPDYFLPNSFNLAYSSQSLMFDKIILEKYINDLKNLKRVIIPISYFSLRKDIDLDEKSVRKYDYYRYHDIDLDIIEFYEIEKYSIIVNKGFKKSFKVVKDYLISDKNLITCDSLGWEITHGKRKKINFADDAKKYIGYHTQGIDDYSFNLQVLSEIERLLAAKGIKMILITTPVTSYYNELLDSTELEKIAIAINDFAKSNPNVEYHDYLQEPSFVIEEFYDSNHLNEAGAIKLSKILAKDITIKD